MPKRGWVHQDINDRKKEKLKQPLQLAPVQFYGILLGWRLKAFKNAFYI